MHKSLITLFSAAFLAVQASAAEYKVVADWMKLPPGQEKMGGMHGDIAVSSAGEIYVSVLDTNPGIQVYAPDGKYLRNVPNAPSDFHGFVIRKDATGEYIYGPRLAGQSVVKMKLDGTVVFEIPASVIPDDFKVRTPATKKNKKGEETKIEGGGKSVVRLTGMDVAPNGDLYVTDGYSSDYVHRFDKTGKYITSFGGKGQPYGLKTLHKIAIDTRFNPARIIGADRENMRVVHLSLDGKFIGVVASDILRPAAVTVMGDYALVGEIKGQVCLIDKAGNVVKKFGTNTVAEETATNKVEPAKWRPGIVNAPHGVAYDAKGNVYVAEYSVFGRVHKFEAK